MQDWSEIGPTLTKKLLNENPDQELEALRAAKTMGDTWQQVTALIDSIQENVAFISQLQKEQAAINQSRHIQQVRHKKKIENNNLSLLWDEQS